MPSWTTIQLDTTAPVVTWGAVSGAQAGATLSVSYTSNEPIARATLTLPDLTVVEMDVELTLVSADIPSSTPSGVATIRVYDDVLNGTDSLEPTIEGETPPQPPPPPSLDISVRGGGYSR